MVGIIDNIHTNSEDFTLLCYQGWYCDNTPTTGENFTILLY